VENHLIKVRRALISVSDKNGVVEFARALLTHGVDILSTGGTAQLLKLNGIVVTESGLVFGAGGDNQIRAWDSDTGRQLWVSRFGGNFIGSPVMYETGGRQYVLVPASASAARSSGTGTTAPLGWIAYALRTR